MSEIKRDSPEWNRRMGDYMAMVVERIREHGWMIQGVFPVESDPEPFAPFYYTVGMTEAGLPEVVLSALPHDIAMVILNETARRHLADELVVGEVWECPRTEITNPLKLKVVAVPPGHHWLGTAHRLYGRRRVRAVQVLWCDQNGMFPGGMLHSGPAQPLASDHPEPRPEPAAPSRSAPRRARRHQSPGGVRRFWG